MRVTEQQAERIFKSLSKMKILNRLMDFEYNMEMPDIAKSSLVRNHLSRIRESIAQVQVNLNHVIKTKEEEVLDEYCSEFLDTIELIALMEMEQLKAFNSDLKQFLDQKGEKDAA